MWLFNHLESTLQLYVKNCCLQYPSETSERLKNRVLLKWFHIQKDFGEQIDVSKCNVNVQLEIREPMGCDNTRDIIYLLLKHSMDVIKQSTQNISKIKRDRM
jgi:hypothetical protein